MSVSTMSRANITWAPLTRDGGAMLHRQYSLHTMTDGRNRDAFYENFEKITEWVNWFNAWLLCPSGCAHCFFWQCAQGCCLPVCALGQFRSFLPSKTSTIILLAFLPCRSVAALPFCTSGYFGPPLAACWQGYWLNMPRPLCRCAPHRFMTLLPTLPASLSGWQ